MDGHRPGEAEGKLRELSCPPIIGPDLIL
jgi:hypothetical protein